MMVTKTSIIFIPISICLSLISLFRSENFDRDFSQYQFLFGELDTAALSEPGFNLLLAIGKDLDLSITFILFLCTLISILIKFKSIAKFGSTTCSIFLLLYASSFFLLHELNQTRLALSIAFIFPALINRDISSPLKILLSIIAFSFHYSIIVVIPFIFIKNENKIFLPFLLFCVIYEFFRFYISTDLVNSIPDQFIINLEKIKLYLHEIAMPSAEIINFTNPGSIATIIFIGYIGIFRYINQHREYNYLMTMSYMSIVSYYILRENPVIATRISELYRTALPLIIAISFSATKKSPTNLILKIIFLPLIFIINVVLYGPSIKPINEVISFFGINREI